MPFNKLNSHHNQTILVLLIFTLFGCGSFSSSSLVSSDGIYNSESKDESSSSKYYENYFKEKAFDLENEFVFSDSLSLNSEFITSNDINYNSSNPSWGDIPDATDYIIDYSPYRNRFFGYGYGYGGYYGMYPYYGNWYPGFSYYPMRNYHRYGGVFGYYNSFYFDFYPYGYWGSTMPFGYRNRYSSYQYQNNYNSSKSFNQDISVNKGRRGSASNVVVYGSGRTVSNGSTNQKDVERVSSYNVGRPSSLENDTPYNDNDLRIRSYNNFVKSKSSTTIERSRIYSRPEMGVSSSGSQPSSNNKNQPSRRYYTNPSSTKLSNGNSPTSNGSNWGLSGRNSSSNKSNNVRTYSNPSSSLNSNSRNSYSTPTRNSSSSYSRPPSNSTSSSSSSSSSVSSSSGSSRGSR